MENFLHILFIWTHLLGVAVFVGGQFFLAFAWVPASRQIGDLNMRLAAMKTVTQRFAWLGGAGLVLILVAGGYLIATWRDYYAQPDDLEFTSIRFGVIFIVKMSVLVVMLAILAAHIFWLGPKLLEELEVEATGGSVDQDHVKRLRMQSMALSITGLVLTLAIMAMGVSMTATNYSFQEA